MSIYLLDVNILVALAWSTHAHHAIVNQWFATHGNNGWATCPITQSGFVRISSNPCAVDPKLSVEQSIDALRKLIALPSHQFWADELQFEDAITGFKILGHQQITDAYLVGLARHHKAKLATLDRAILALGKSVELVTASTV